MFVLISFQQVILSSLSRVNIFLNLSFPPASLLLKSGNSERDYYKKSLWKNDPIV